ncbi:YIP1 family protein [Sagittula sp. S175]|uniref:YIP1 family protein n=1 Tax=Sagittula sp. S175 TaxID=3415129 RepID=UPI003C7EC8A2
MTLQGFVNLAIQSIGAPRDVARLLMSTRMSREALWTAFALVVVANATVYGLSLVMDPAPAGVPVFLSTAAGYLVVEAITLGGTILALTWLGRLLGGAGRMADVALLMIWMQALNLIVQAVTSVLLPLSPEFAGIVVLAGSAIGFWIMLNFIDEAHGLGSLFKAFFVFLLSLLALGFVLSMILVLAGFTPEGMMGNV